MWLQFLLGHIQLWFQVLLEQVGEGAHENKLVFPQL